ncbi:hypothetical protein ACI65C_006161 [Semiaphis heraclei]
MMTMSIKRFYSVSIGSQSELYIFSLAMPPPVPRKALNLKQKVDIIRFKDSNGGWSIRKLADKFGIGKTQVAEVLKNKEDILRRYNENSTNEKSRRFQRNGPADFPSSEPPEIENEVNGNELIELMELLPMPRNDDFATIDSNLSTECSSDDIAIILDDIRTELNPVESDDEQQADDQLQNSEIKTFSNYSEALEQLIRLKEFYLNKGDEKGFSHVSELIFHHELEMTKSKFKKQTSIESFFKK